MITDPDVVPALVFVVENVWTPVKNVRTEFVFVSGKFTLAPVIPAVTLYGPTVAEAVRVDDVAMPDAFVTAVHAFFAVWGVPTHAPPAVAKNLPVAPVFGLVNVTVTPDTGLPLESVTRADNCWENCVLTLVDWLFPLQGTIFVGSPAVTVVDTVADVRPVAAAVIV
jgi:hypothetical protein